jgi:hypothetical protein
MRRKRKKEERKERDQNASIYSVSSEDLKRAARKKRKKKREGTYVGVPGFECVAHEAFFVEKKSRVPSELRSTKFPEVDKCAICLEKPLDAVFATKCFHYYCGSCILKWLRVTCAEASSDFKKLPKVLTGVCPLCKYPFHISRDISTSSCPSRSDPDDSLSVEFFVGDDNIFLHRVVSTRSTRSTNKKKSGNIITPKRSTK